MDFSVVVPTYNRRESLAECLDRLSEHASDVEVIVVNGPSTDGTSGMVRNRDDVDVLLEVAERNINVARNAGIAAASGSTISFLGQNHRVTARWLTSIRTAIGDGIDFVTGPIMFPLSNGDSPRRTRRKNDLDLVGGNIALTRETVLSVDGFDEYLLAGGIKDIADRASGIGQRFAWMKEMAVQLVESETTTLTGNWAMGFLDEQNLSSVNYRSLAYRQTKNNGPRPFVASDLVRRSIIDAGTVARDVIRGTVPPTAWFATGLDVIASLFLGAKDGMIARRRDRTPTRNPYGLSRRLDRVVERSDYPHRS